MNNKGRRNELKQLKYKKRLARWIAQGGIYRVDGDWADNPNTHEAMRAHAHLGFKTSSVLCSCYGCSGAWKYKRHIKKQEDKKLIEEALKEYYATN